MGITPTGPTNPIPEVPEQNEQEAKVAKLITVLQGDVSEFLNQAVDPSIQAKTLTESFKSRFYVATIRFKNASGDHPKLTPMVNELEKFGSQTVSQVSNIDDMQDAAEQLNNMLDQFQRELEK